MFCCIHLHNFLRRNSNSRQFHSPPGTLDYENVDEGMIIQGSWHTEIENDTGMINLNRIPRRPNEEAKTVRDNFMNYFMSTEGRVCWQDKYL